MKEKLDTLWQLLGCTNADIARILNCSPTLISRIRTGSREYSPASRPVKRLADGLYRYADSQNKIPALQELCGAKADDYAGIVTALTAWLFGLDGQNSPTSKRDTIKQRQLYFGEKLNSVMELLELSNMQLAKKINMDASAVSRFRNGVRIPKSPISDLLASELIEQAEKQEKIKELCELCSFRSDQLPDDYTAFSSWLYDSDNLSDVSGIESLLSSIEHFRPLNAPRPEDLRHFATNKILYSDKKLYWGIDGLREAVIRFLGTAANEGGELWLYSSQSMKWMTGDSTYQMKWSALMAACIGRGVKVRIIHNIDRGTPEILSAIKSWLPLYMSGMIESYVWRSGSDFPFSKTIFLRPGNSCILASPLKNNEETGWYEYITDEPRLKAVASDYSGLLARSTPLVKIFRNDYQGAFDTNKNDKNIYVLLSALSLGTMPDSLLTEILNRNAINKEEQEKIRKAHAFHQKDMRRFMSTGKVIELLALPSAEMLAAGKIRVNLFQSLSDTVLFYTPEEFANHIQAVQKLITEEANYELILLPEMPFDRIQITETESRVSVMRDEPPCTVFLLTEPHIVRAFHSYISLLVDQYRSDRHTALQELTRFL